MPAPSKIETELMKITKLRQATGEPRKTYLHRLLLGGQKIAPDVWEGTLSTEAQSWYNDAVTAFMTHTQPSDIPDFPDLPPATTTRLAMPPAAPPPAPIEDPADDEAAIDEPEADPETADSEFEEDVAREPEPEPEPEPVQRAAAKPPAPKPASRPAPKPASTPKKAAAPKPVAAPQPAPQPEPKPARASSGNGSAAAAAPAAAPGVSKPPKGNSPGASTMVKRMLIENFNITNAEIMERLKAEGINVTQISVSTIRSDFKHSLLILHEAGYATEIGPSA